MGEFYEFINNHTVELYAQDKWKMGGRTTLSAGIRYDLEIIPLNEDFNPLFPASNKNYPVDRNNFAPRIGLTHALDSSGKTVLRGGYGLFYNRTVLGSIDDTMEQGKMISFATVNFPNDNADPGPAAGRFPTDPYLVNGPFVNTTLLRQQYPLGVPQKNNGAVVFDSPDRRQPYAHQATVGFGHELSSAIAVQADYIHMVNKDMFLARNLNPMVRANTSRTGPITRVDAFGVLGEPYAQQVWVMENTGESKYDALNLSLEKRYSNNWSGRVSYSLSKSRGNAFSQADKNTYQFLTDLNLDQLYGPQDVDRRHVLSINGRTEIPKTRGSHPVFYSSVYERRAVHHLRQQHRRQPERRAGRSVTGRNLQRHRPECDDECGKQGRPAQRCPRARLLAAGSAGRLARPDGRKPGARAVPRHLQHHQPHQLG